MLRRHATLFRSINWNQPVCHVRLFAATTRLKTRVSKKTADDDAAPPKRKRGRPRKDETTVVAIKARPKQPDDIELKAEPERSNAKKTKRSRKSTSASKLPPRLVQPSPNHHDLDSFLAYATRVSLNKATNVFKGTLYEYSVAAVLSRLNFTLHRTGRSNDLGIDLVGHFHLPKVGKAARTRKANSLELKVLVQCKALKPTPSMVRELEGAHAGAPAGWRGDNVLALLVASKAATKGVRDALQRSRWPMGLVQVTSEGEVKQFLWNAVAEEIGLAGLGVTVKYADSTNGVKEDDEEAQREGKVQSSIALTWLGELWKSADAIKS